MAVAMTTVDNPHNPFTDFEQWWVFDHLYGYFSSEKVAALAHVSEQFTDAENEEEYEKAIDRWISLDILGLYVKVTPETVDNVIKNAINGTYLSIDTVKSPSDVK